eukprot:XP_017449271.1 PREDICTED: low-density lipoprotein receptor class A domain-containing protein 1 isoform X3 [Rattus norvegicus]
MTTGRKTRPGGEGCGPLCYSRRGACLSVFLLLLLAMLAALLLIVTILGHPQRTPEPHSCVTLANRTGFLCHDRRYCIPAHAVCDGIRTCPHGEDEAENLCRDLPKSLPSFLLTTCGNPDSWIYSDQKCDGTNNCGDCSDELSPGGGWAQVGSGQGHGLSGNPHGPLHVPESWEEHFHCGVNDVLRHPHTLPQHWGDAR